MNLEQVPISSLNLYSNNSLARHQRIKSLKSNIKKIGHIVPLLVTEKKRGVYSILDGNRRYSAIKSIVDDANTMIANYSKKEVKDEYKKKHKDEYESALVDVKNFKNINCLLIDNKNIEAIYEGVNTEILKHSALDKIYSFITSGNLNIISKKVYNELKFITYILYGQKPEESLNELKEDILEPKLSPSTVLQVFKIICEALNYDTLLKGIRKFVRYQKAEDKQSDEDMEKLENVLDYIIQFKTPDIIQMREYLNMMKLTDKQIMDCIEQDILMVEENME